MNEAQDAEYRYHIGLSSRVICSHVSGIANMAKQLEASRFNQTCIDSLDDVESALLQLRIIRRDLLAKTISA